MLRVVFRVFDAKGGFCILEGLPHKVMSTFPTQGMLCCFLRKQFVIRRDRGTEPHTHRAGRLGRLQYTRPEIELIINFSRKVFHEMMKITLTV